MATTLVHDFPASVKVLQIDNPRFGSHCHKFRHGSCSLRQPACLPQCVWSNFSSLANSLCATSGFAAALSCCSNGSVTASNSHVPPERYGAVLLKAHGMWVEAISGREAKKLA